jgi:hypothetical protein
MEDCVPEIEDSGSPRPGPKYRIEIVKPWPDWPDSDERLLARMAKGYTRLVSRYGDEAVAERMKVAIAPLPPRRGRGRPPRGNLPVLENMHLADWIDENAEEFRRDGSRTPIKDAEHALYEMIFDDEQKRKPDHFQRWQKNIKKKRLQGRRDLIVSRRIAAARDQWIARQWGRK